MKGILIDGSNERNKEGASQHLQAKKSRQMARHLDLDDEDCEWDIDSRSQYKIGLSRAAFDELMFYRNLFVPVISTYQDVVIKFKSLIDLEPISVEEFLRTFNNELNERDIGRLPIILTRFEAMKVVEMTPTEYKGVKNILVLWLTEEWNNNVLLDLLSINIHKYVSL